MKLKASATYNTRHIIYKLIRATSIGNNRTATRVVMESVNWHTIQNKNNNN